MRIDPRLSRILERARVPIEVTADHRPFDDAGTTNWRDYKWLLAGKSHRGGRPDLDRTAPLDRVFLDEEHHRQYGRPWLLGRYIFDYVVAQGVKPTSRLLDIGCGAMRFGTHAIRYLDAGRYFGVDPHLKSLEAAVTYELPLHGLEEKQPRLLWDDRYSFAHFGTEFDFAVDFATSIHVPEADLNTLFRNAAATLAPGGRLLVALDLRVGADVLADVGLRLIGEEVQECPLLVGHAFDPTNRWFVLERAG